jgi:hypothetical protein
VTAALLWLALLLVAGAALAWADGDEWPDGWQ